jgi:hypothetical protein
MKHNVLRTHGSLLAQVLVVADPLLLVAAGIVVGLQYVERRLV